jgi:hypothetical protein
MQALEQIKAIILKKAVPISNKIKLQLTLKDTKQLMQLTKQLTPKEENLAIVDLVPELKYLKVKN